MTTPDFPTSSSLASSLSHPGSVSELSTSDPRRQVVEKLRDGSLSLEGGSPNALFLTLLQDSCPGITLKDLPVEVAQAILDNRHATMQAFFESWGESIRLNAELDKEASQKALKKKEDQGRRHQSTSFFASALQRALNKGDLSEKLAQELRNKAGFSLKQPEAPSEDNASSLSAPPPASTESALRAPRPTGVGPKRKP